MELSQMREKLRPMLTEHRYRHSLGVMETAVRLAKRHGAPEEKARIAGLLHDCAKDIDKDEMLVLCDALGVPLDPVKREQRSLIHADLGAMLARTQFGVCDPEILDAIRYHTLGRPAMTALEKILYIADCIEPNRDPQPELAELRLLAERDLDEAMLCAVESSIRYVKSKGKLLHEQSLLTQRYYKKLVSDQKKEKVMMA